MARKNDEQRAEALNILRREIKPTQTAYTTLRHRTASGMSCSVSVVVVNEDGRLHDWSWAVARALGWPFDDRNGGVKVGGCGQDAGFHLVYTLGAAMWPEGTPKPHGKRNGQPDSSGGYALHHEWL